MSRRLLISGLLIIGIIFYSCQSKTSKKYSSNKASNSSKRLSGISGGERALTKKDTVDANSAKKINKSDLNAKSDSKGVGKFTTMNIKLSARIDTVMAAKGRAIFLNSCTACHSATTQKLIGPGLKGITKIRTPQWIMNMITDPVKMTHNDPVAEALLQDENGVQMTNQNITNQGAREILEFFRQNDE